jgi:hypothetical protein
VGSIFSMEIMYCTTQQKNKTEHLTLQTTTRIEEGLTHGEGEI